MSILLHLKDALVCSLNARLFIARMAFFRRTKILEVLFWYESKVYEKLVFHKLSSFSEKYVFLHAAQFTYRKGLGRTEALRTISHHLQKSLDTRIESYIIQLDFSDAFDRVSHSDLLFKLKSICVGGSVLSICRKFLSNRR